MAEGFHKALPDNSFIPVSPYVNRFKPEKWAFNFNPNNNQAQAWVHYTFDKSVYEKKRRKSVAADITILTYGANNQLYIYLKDKIIANCRHSGQVLDEINNTILEEYIHSSGASFRYFSLDGENIIRVHNSTKIVREK